MVMTAEWSVPAWAVLAAGLAILAVVVVAAWLALSAMRRTRRRAEASQAASLARVQALDEQVALIERRLAARQEPTADLSGTEYVVTMLGRDGDHEGSEDGDRREPAPVVDAPLFADLVLREGVVQAASLAAGLRRALDPAHLNRIRFEMRREVKRARKQRRADLRQAKREYDARGRAGEAAA